MNRSIRMAMVVALSLAMAMSVTACASFSKQSGFLDGYYKAFVMLAGPCVLCKECGKVEGVPCRLPAKTRPAMEACGIDVFQTARNNGFSITTLKEKSETQNLYCLMLVD